MENIFKTKNEAIAKAILISESGSMWNGWHLPIFKIESGYMIGSWTQNNTRELDKSKVAIVYSVTAEVHHLDIYKTN